MLKSNVSVIPATVRFMQNGGQLRTQKNIRVAAYCRVSTGDESQQTSYLTQKTFYTNYILSNEGWNFAGIYADEALSGTSRAGRVEFNRMMEDAKAGKMDYIVSKSISRFARNTVDTLTCIRELRQLSPPVGVYFEKENIDTLDATGELILTILSALAQDESRSISDNIRWSIQRNFQMGKPQINLKRMLGYDMGENGEWLVNQKQAEIVRFIFRRFVSGQSANKIAGELNKLGKTTVHGKKWLAGGVLIVLRNEKYVGDLEMQKTVTKDFLTHRSIKNNGEAPRYYIENHHMPIIDRLTWNKVQAMLQGEKTLREKEMEKERKLLQEKDVLLENEMLKEETVCQDEGKKDQAGRKGKMLKKALFQNIVCGELLSDGRECDSRLSRMSYTGTASGYLDERSLKATGGDTENYLEKYTFSYPVWRCERKKEKQKETCKSELYHEVALEQSFMEMLYRLKRDYETKGEDSDLFFLFKKVCKEFGGEGDLYGNGISEENNFSFGTLSREEVLYGKDSLEKASYLSKTEYEKESYDKKIEELEIMKKNFSFFLECLKQLPEQNAAGMRIHVNGLDLHGTLLRDEKGNPLPGKTAELRRGRIKITPEKLKTAPDLLCFEKGIYCAFFEQGKAVGDTVTYKTNFGIELWTSGNQRKLASFLGYRKCDLEGNVQYIDAPYKVYEYHIQYRRYPRRGEK